MVLATTAQTVAVLLLAIKLAPAAGLSSFCKFAAVAVVLDLMAFFVFLAPALAVNLRPLGLQDSVDKDQQSRALREGSLPASRKYPEKKYQIKVHEHRRSDIKRLSANLLTTIGLTCFVCVHFIDNYALPIGHGAQSDTMSTRRPYSPDHLPTEPSDIVTWLQAQSSRTLRELVEATMPHSTSFVAKVQAPLLVVTDAAARAQSVPNTDTNGNRPVGSRLALSVFLMILLSIWAVRFGDRGRAGHKVAEGDERNGDVMLVRCLPAHHELDIFLLAPCPRRFLVSVGFDRKVQLWNLEASAPRSTLIATPSDEACPVGWPVSLVAIDDHAEWLAICSRVGRVALWNRRTERFGQTVTVERGERVVACSFVAVPNSPGINRHKAGFLASTRLIVILRSGQLLDLDVDGAETITTHKTCDGPVQSVHVSSTATGGRSHVPNLRLIIVTRHHSVFVSIKREGWWMTRPLRITAIPPLRSPHSSPESGQSQATCFAVVESLRGVALLHNEEAGVLHLVDMLSDALIYTFRRRVAPHHASLRAIHTPARQCVFCGSTAVTSFSVAFTENVGLNPSGSAFTMVTVEATVPTRSTMCLRSERDTRERRCVGFGAGVESTHRMDNPGSWETTGANTVGGVRRLHLGRDQSLYQPYSATATPSTSGAYVRWSKQDSKSPPDSRWRLMSSTTREDHGSDCWEAWTMTARGLIVTQRVSAASLGLVVDTPGPVCRLARNAVAVGVANAIIVVQLGSRLRDDDDSIGEGAESIPTHGRLARRSSGIGKAPNWRLNGTH